MKYKLSHKTLSVSSIVIGFKVKFKINIKLNSKYQLINPEMFASGSKKKNL